MKKTFSFILALILLAFIAISSIKGMYIVFNAFAKLNVSLQTGIATALSLIVVAVVGYFANKSIETRKSVEQAMRPRKLELYEGFIKFFLKVMAQDGTVKKPTQKQIVKFFVDSNPLIVTFASNSVIEKWGKLRVGMTDGDPIKNIFQLEDLLKEIRKDLGHTKRGSQKGDILRLFVNDIDKYLKSSNKG